MKTIIEVLARLIFVSINIALLMIAEPYFKEMFPLAARFSTHIIYTCIVIITLWIFVPLMDWLHDDDDKKK